MANVYVVRGHQGYYPEDEDYSSWVDSYWTTEDKARKRIDPIKRNNDA